MAGCVFPLWVPQSLASPHFTIGPAESLDGHLLQSYLSTSLGTTPDPPVLDSGRRSSSEGVRSASFPMGAHGVSVASAIPVGPVWIPGTWALLIPSCLCGISS